MKRQIKAVAAVLFSFFLLYFSLTSAGAEVIPQSFTLQPGWNAVFLEVEPEATSPAEVFSGVPDLESVWMWNPKNSTVEYIQNPDTLVPGQPPWLVYMPNNPIVTNLFAIHGETAYLIKLGGTAEITWEVIGQPLLPHIDWKQDSYNLVGFHLEEGEEPFFLDFFSTSPAHSGQKIYILDNPTASWVQVEDSSIRMKHGEAFWVYCEGHSKFVGPLSVKLEQGTGLHYGTTLVEQELRLFNHGAQEKTVALTVSSEAVHLYYWLFDPQNNLAGWVEFPTDSPITLPIAPGENRKIRLGVRRAGLTAGTTYEANLTAVDGQGMRILIPVSVTGVDYSGLWVGRAAIQKVSQPASDSNPNTPVNAGSEFDFRLIVHVDDTEKFHVDDTGKVHVDAKGKVRLLHEVTQLWQEGTWKPDPNEPDKLIQDEPGRFVLVVNDSNIPNYSGAALRDGQLVGRRISTAAFGFSGPLDMTGDFQLGSDLSVTVELPPGDPTNPFRHKYHPDHKLPEQSYQVSRSITLQLRDLYDQGDENTTIPILSWGITDFGGIYKETIEGLHRQKIHIEGTFTLHKVCSASLYAKNLKSK